MLVKDLSSPYLEMALANQVLQNNKPKLDVSVVSVKTDSNFDWDCTFEKAGFWYEIEHGRTPEITEKIKKRYPGIFALNDSETTWDELYNKFCAENSRPMGNFSKVFDWLKVNFKVEVKKKAEINS